MKTNDMRNFILSFLLLTPFIFYSQNTIKGRLKDKIDVIAYANVILNSKEGELVTGAITDENGFFVLDVAKGEYNLLISYIGYKSIKKEIVLNEDIDLGDIIFEEESVQLESVVVVGNRKLIQRKVDRLVFNIENNVSASGGDALDALKVAPGVTFSNDKISIIGKSEMRVMVDGTILELSGEDLVGFLTSIPADDIKSIEIITNPPAKYEAAGNSGLINIIYKKGRNNSWSNTTSFSYQLSRFATYRLRNNFNYQKDRVKFLFSISGETGDLGIWEELNIDFTEGPWATNTNQRKKTDNLSGRVMFDYDLGERSTIGIQYLGVVTTPDFNDVAITTIRNNANVIDSLLVSDGSRNEEKVNQSLNAHFNTKLDTLGSNLSVNLDYFNYRSDFQRDISTDNVLPDGQFLRVGFANNTVATQDIENYSAKIDVEHSFEKFRLAYGGKLSHINTDNVTQNFDLLSGSGVLDPNTSNEFEYMETNQALYVSASKNLTSKLETKFGLRVENTNTEGFSRTLNQTNENDYIKLFPTFYLSYHSNDNNNFSFNYGKRINRPNFAQLNPARLYLNSNAFSVGNPFLQPSFTDNLEFNHTYKSNLTTQLFFSVETDGFGVVPTLNDATNEQEVNFQNYFKNYNYGIAEFYTFNKISWLESQNSFYFINSSSRITNDNVDAEIQNGARYFLSTYNTFSLNKDKSIRAQLNFWYSSSYRRNLFLNEEIYSLDFAMRFNLMDDKLQLSAGVTDIFNTSAFKISSTINGIDQSFFANSSNQYFRFSITYKTGNKKINVREGRSGNEEEKRRAGN